MIPLCFKILLLGKNQIFFPRYLQMKFWRSSYVAPLEGAQVLDYWESEPPQASPQRSRF